MTRNTTGPDRGPTTDDVGGDRDEVASGDVVPDTRVSVQSIPFRFTPARKSVRRQQLGWFLGSVLAVGSVTWGVAYGVSLATVATFLIGVVLLAVSFPLAELRAGSSGGD